MATLILDEEGDLTALPGSKKWSIAVRDKLQVLVRERKTTDNNITPYLELIEQHEGYRQLEKEDGTKFVSIQDFLETRYPFGLSGEVERLNGGYTLKKTPGRPQQKKGNYNNYNNYRTPVMQGTHKPYILARLERDHPTILLDYHAGRYRSARQAGIAAGFIKDTKRLQVEPVPEKIAKKLRDWLTPDQIREVIELLQGSEGKINNAKLNNSIPPIHSTGTLPTSTKTIDCTKRGE